MTVLLIGLLSCQNQKTAENGSFTTASYNLRYANAEDSAAAMAGENVIPCGQTVTYHGFRAFSVLKKDIPGNWKT